MPTQSLFQSLLKSAAISLVLRNWTGLLRFCILTAYTTESTVPADQYRILHCPTICYCFRETGVSVKFHIPCCPASVPLMKDPSSINNCLFTNENTQRHQVSQYFPNSFSEALPPVLKGPNACNQREKLTEAIKFNVAYGLLLYF